MRSSTLVLLALALVALLASAEAGRVMRKRFNAPRLRHQEKREIRSTDVQNALQFLLGFGEGLEYDWAANFSQCVQQQQATVDQFVTAWTQLQNGFEHRSIEEIAAGLKSFGNGIEQVKSAASECGAVDLVVSLTKLISEIQSGQVFEVVIAEGINIFYHGVELKDDFEGAASSWQAANYEESGGYVGKIVGILIRD